MLFSCKRDEAQKQVIKQKPSKEVILYNWKEYTCLETLKEFETETGIKVILKEFETINEQIASIQSNPQLCDLTVFDSHMAKNQFTAMKLIKKLNTSKLNNMPSYLNEFQEFIDVGIPYSFGMTGYAIDTRKVKKEFKNYEFLFNPEYKGKIALLDDPVDFFLTLLVASGKNINQALTPKVLKDIETNALKLKNNSIDFNETFTNLDLLVEGKRWIVQTYNGDAASYMQEHDYIKFFYHPENYNAWSEIICLTNNAPNEENAYKLLNYLSTARAAAQFSNEFMYANGISGSEKFLNKEIRSNPLINPSRKIRETGKLYHRSKEGNSAAQRIFSILTSSAASSP